MLAGKKILIVHHSMFETCPRPKRLYYHFSKKNEVHVACRNLENITGITNYPIIRWSQAPLVQWLRKIALYTNFMPLIYAFEKPLYKVVIDEMQLEKYDVIFIHDLILLPYFEKHFNKVVFDAREYYPLQSAENKAFRKELAKLYRYLCKKFIPKVKHRITVSQSIANIFYENYGISFSVFPSYPLANNLQVATQDNENDEFSSTNSRNSAGNKIRIIHHGGAMKNRNIEKLIELAKLLDDRFHLYLMLMPSDKHYLQELWQIAKGVPNVTFIPPVDFEEIIPFTSNFDIGIHLLESQVNQHPFSLPNKFFEYAAAGLMVVVSGSKEMVDYTRNYEMGIAYDGVVSLNELAESINSLTEEEVKAFKTKTKNASVDFTFQKIIPELEKSVENIIKNTVE